MSVLRRLRLQCLQQIAVFGRNNRGVFRLNPAPTQGFVPPHTPTSRPVNRRLCMFWKDQRGDTLTNSGSSLIWPRTRVEYVCSLSWGAFYLLIPGVVAVHRFHITPHMTRIRRVAAHQARARLRHV
jgi:hypothetical protein